MHVISMLAFISFYASYILHGYTSDQEREIRKFRAETIAQDKDVFSEFEYAELESKLEADGFVLPYFEGYFDHSAFSEKLEEDYFSKLKDNYQLKFFLYDRRQNLREDPRDFDVKEFDRFQEIVNE